MRFKRAPLLLIVATAATSGAQTIVNGDFELAVPSNGSGNGWTSSNIDGSGGWRVSGGNPNGAFILNEAGSVGTDPTLTQTITGLTSGQVYTITGDFTSIYHSFGSPELLDSFGVSVDGVFGFEAGKTQEGVWNSFSFNFTATGTTADLLIAAERNGDDSSYIVDNLAINAVPEPATLAVLSLGALFLARRSRKA